MAEKPGRGSDTSVAVLRWSDGHFKNFSRLVYPHAHVKLGSIQSTGCRHAWNLVVRGDQSGYEWHYLLP